MSTNKVIIQNKHEAFTTMEKVRRDLSAIRAKEFDLTPVNEYSAIQGIFFDIKLKEQLREMGALNLKGIDEKGNIMWQYGYHRSNENNAAVNNALYAADKLLLDVLNFLQNCHITPKRHFSEAEKSMFTLIIGGNQDTYLSTQLKGGADYA